MRPGLDDKVLADWNGLMIAALANGGALLGEPGWIDMAERAFEFIASCDDPRRPARPFLARRPAAVPGPRLGFRLHDQGRARAATRRPANAATSSRPVVVAARARPSLRQSGQWRLFPHRRRRRRPGGASGRDARRRDAEPERHRRRATWCGSRCSPATMPGAHRPTACSTACSSAAGQNLIGHAALLNALDLRLRGAEIVVTGSGARADALLAAARKLSFLDRIVLRAAERRRLARRASGARQDRNSAAKAQRSSASASAAPCRWSTRSDWWRP